MTTPPLLIQQDDGSYIAFGGKQADGTCQVSIAAYDLDAFTRINREQAIQVIQHLAKVFELSLAAVGELEADQ